MGFVILGCLEKFAREVKNGENSLSASLTAALTSMDATIHRILKDLSNQVSDDPLFDLILSPLFAACVATTSFLRMYSVAQHRLEAILLKRPKRHSDSLFPKYSELLWSQLVHLRMSLPSDSVTETDPTEINIKEYIDPSPSFHRDAKLLADRIDSLGLNLCHVALIGDRNLDSQDKVRDVLLRMMAGEKVSNAQKAIELNNLLFDYPGAVSPLPFSLLLSAQSITSLCIQDCQLKSLPASFGHYFHSLSVRCEQSSNDGTNVMNYFILTQCHLFLSFT